MTVTVTTESYLSYVESETGDREIILGAVDVGETITFDDTTWTSRHVEPVPEKTVLDRKELDYLVTKKNTIDSDWGDWNRGEIPSF